MTQDADKGALQPDRDKRWIEIQALSNRVARKDGAPTEIESALCGAVVRAREWLEELEATKELFAASATRSHGAASTEPTEEMLQAALDADIGTLDTPLRELYRLIYVAMAAKAPPSSIAATVDGPLGGFATVGREAAELDLMLTQFQTEAEMAADEESPVEERQYHGAMALDLKRNIIDSYTPSARPSASGTLMDEAGKFFDWGNAASVAMKNLLDAYERRIRSLCTPEQLEQKPWECAEFIEARRALEAKPNWFIAVPSDGGHSNG